MEKGESVAGVLAWKRELPDGKAAMVLVRDGNGTLHRGIVHDVGDIRTGNRVALNLARDAQATLSRGPERGRGMGTEGNVMMSHRLASGRLSRRFGSGAALPTFVAAWVSV